MSAISQPKALWKHIPKFTRGGAYVIDVPWRMIEFTLEGWAKDQPVNTDPDYQRAHVWNEEQQRRYVEYIMRGGYAAKEIRWNCTTWTRSPRYSTPVELVDGKQRLEAVRKFMRGELMAFGHFFADWDGLDILVCTMKWYVNDLSTRAEVLQWYIDLNTGGVIHSDEEIQRVRALLEQERRPAQQEGV